MEKDYRQKSSFLKVKLIHDFNNFGTSIAKKERKKKDAPTNENSTASVCFYKQNRPIIL